MLRLPASPSLTRSGGLAAVIMVGRHAFAKRKLILEREKKADRLNGRTRRAKVASVQCEKMDEEVSKKKEDADPRTRGRQAGRHVTSLSRTDEETLSLSVCLSVCYERAADRGSQPEPGEPGA